jgi:hypothetical protein
VAPRIHRDVERVAESVHVCFRSNLPRTTSAARSGTPLSTNSAIACSFAPP